MLCQTAITEEQIAPFSSCLPSITFVLVLVCRPFKVKLPRMAAVVALVNVLGSNAVSIIFDFLEDSSVATTCDTDIMANDTMLRSLDEFRVNGQFGILYRGSLEYAHRR